MSIFSGHEFISPEVIGDFETAWYTISTCENPSSIRRILQSRFRDSYKESDFDISQIAASFSMGHRYFCEARKVSLAVKPLLAFYGMVNIAAGVILMRERGSRIESLKQNHGLAFMRQPGKPLGQQLTKVNSSGTFATFNDVSSRYDIMMPGSYVGVGTDSAEDMASAEFPLEELLSRLPELKYEIHLNLGCKSRVFRGTTESKTEDGTTYHYYTFSCHKQLDENDTLIVDLFPELRDCEHETTELSPLHSAIRYRMPARPDNKGTKWLPCFVSINRETYLIAKLGGHHVSEVAIHYMTAFLVSNIVRYAPEIWENTLNGTINTGMRPYLTSSTGFSTGSFQFL